MKDLLKENRDVTLKKSVINNESLTFRTFSRKNGVKIYRKINSIRTIHFKEGKKFTFLLLLAPDKF